MHGMAPAMSPGGRRRGPGGVSGGARGGRGGSGPRGPRPGRPQMPGVAGAMPVPMAAPTATVDPLAPDMLAQASPEERKNLIGERLYGLISASQPSLAGKITGMLLEVAGVKRASRKRACEHVVQQQSLETDE